MPEKVLSEVSEIVVDAEAICDCVGRVAEEVRGSYEGVEAVKVIVLMEGARRFGEDLFGRIGEDKFDLEYVNASSYYGGTQSSGEVIVEGLEKEELCGREVLIVDDIYDTGLTLRKVLDEVKGMGAAGVRCCVLFVKDVEHNKEVEIDFEGMRVPDKFLIGYGLDYNQKYRELDYVAALDVDKL